MADPKDDLQAWIAANPDQDPKITTQDFLAYHAQQKQTQQGEPWGDKADRFLQTVRENSPMGVMSRGFTQMGSSPSVMDPWYVQAAKAGSRGLGTVMDLVNPIPGNLQGAAQGAATAGTALATGGASIPVQMGAQVGANLLAAELAGSQTSGGINRAQEITGAGAAGLAPGVGKVVQKYAPFALGREADIERASKFLQGGLPEGAPKIPPTKAGVSEALSRTGPTSIRQNAKQTMEELVGPVLQKYEGITFDVPAISPRPFATKEVTKTIGGGQSPIVGPTGQPVDTGVSFNTVTPPQQPGVTLQDAIEAYQTAKPRDAALIRAQLYPQLEEVDRKALDAARLQYHSAMRRAETGIKAGAAQGPRGQIDLRAWQDEARRQDELLRGYGYNAKIKEDALKHLYRGASSMAESDKRAMLSDPNFRASTQATGPNPSTRMSADWWKLGKLLVPPRYVGQQPPVPGTSLAAQMGFQFPQINLGTMPQPTEYNPAP